MITTEAIDIRVHNLIDRIFNVLTFADVADLHVRTDIASILGKLLLHVVLFHTRLLAVARGAFGFSLVEILADVAFGCN